MIVSTLEWSDVTTFCTAEKFVTVTFTLQFIKVHNTTFIISLDAKSHSTSLVVHCFRLSNFRRRVAMFHLKTLVNHNVSPIFVISASFIFQLSLVEN